MMLKNTLLRILLVFATPAEAKAVTGLRRIDPGQPVLLKGGVKTRVMVLVTGAGIAATTYFLTKILTHSRYDVVINMGICGSLNPSIKPVRIVRIVSDQFADFGAEDGDKFLSASGLKLLDPDQAPFKKGILYDKFRYKLPSLQSIYASAGITVQKAHGSVKSVKGALNLFGPVMESMEGAAFFYVCRMEKTECLQIRSVSNMVEKRNRANWKIDEALNSLSGFTSLLLLEFESFQRGKKNEK
jgi:futalosine hydrolase